MQTGLAAVASVADYATNRIRKHELTTPVKEDDRVRQIEAVNAQTGPVMMGYPAAPEIDAMLASATRARPRSTSPPTTACATRCGWSTTTPTIAALTRAVRRAAGALHRRRAPPLGRGGAGRAGARRRDRLARLFPRR